MRTKDIARGIIQFAGYVMMLTALYMIGGLWYPVFLAGLIAWVPEEWFKK